MAVPEVPPLPRVVVPEAIAEPERVIPVAEVRQEIVVAIDLPLAVVWWRRNIWVGFLVGWAAFVLTHRR